VAGRRPVEEAFVAGREAHRLLVVPQRRQALEKLVLHATRLRIPIVELEGGSLTALAGFDGHQGIALVVAPRRFATIDDVLARAAERGEPPFVLALDSLEDPQNVGTLLRSAEAAGVHGILFPTRRQAPLTPAAIKASAGAVEHLLMCPVDDLPGALADLHGHGLRVAGAEAEAPLTARQTDLRGPLAIVVGSEGQGLGPAVRRRCDLLMRIPMRGAVGSLNAAVAGSVLLFEAVAQRDPGGSAAPPRPARVLDEPAESLTADGSDEDASASEPAGATSPGEAVAPVDPVAAGTESVIDTGAQAEPAASTASVPAPEAGPAADVATDAVPELPAEPAEAPAPSGRTRRTRSVTAPPEPPSETEGTTTGDDAATIASSQADLESDPSTNASAASREPASEAGPQTDAPGSGPGPQPDAPGPEPGSSRAAPAKALAAPADLDPARAPRAAVAPQTRPKAESPSAATKSRRGTKSAPPVAEPRSSDTPEDDLLPGGPDPDAPPAADTDAGSPRTRTRRPPSSGA
jgi:23S rRNA (guanosine2251-2'-O)-methyltransferase